MITHEKQVCAREYSEKLKKLGVKQESLWCWYDIRFSTETTAHKLNETRLGSHEHLPCTNDFVDFIAYSAFTVAELGEILPNYIDGDELKCSKDTDNNWWVQYMREDGSDIVAVKANTEANARAKMVIYLLENKLVKI